jgi:molybdopterin-containing oxidoreductase family membrane subunit
MEDAPRPPDASQVQEEAGHPRYRPTGYSFRSVNDKISSIVLAAPLGVGWLGSFALGSVLLLIFLGAVTYLLVLGVGIWGIDIPVAWGFAITSFVWWIGIGHAGTLISAILLLLHQKWRTSINRLAEAMTIFAVMCAGLFPLIHLGRPWFFYWLLPYPTTMRLWPQFRSALIWDVFAVSTYFTVSVLFWYQGMIPDLATLRDRSRSRVGRICYGVLAMGWRNSARHWERYESAYLILGGLATPLVVSVHSVVSSDFAMSNLPGWHETVFPPYFVAGAIFSGFAMVLLLAIPLRTLYHLEDFITINHLNVMGKILLATSLLTSYGYMSEQFMAWYGGEPAESYLYLNRLIGFGQYALITWAIVFCNTLVPQFLWFRSVRRSPFGLFVISLVVLVGMWLERFMIICTSLHRDYLPSSWGMFQPTVWDYLTFFGSLGVFAVLFLLFIRLLPMISISEMPMISISEMRALLTARDVVGATRRARRAGYRNMDAYAPYPVRGLAAALGLSRTRVPFLVLVAGLVGAGVGFLMQYYSMAVDYPFNSGGRPENSWPVFLPITFEVMVLVASFAALLGMLLLNGLPRPHHPVFNVPRFVEASQDRFFLCIEATDAQFDREATRQFLAGLGAREVMEVPHD